MQVINSEKVKTRKSHNCWGCTKEYPVGTVMERTTSVDGGQIATVYWCEQCQEYMDILRDLDVYFDDDTFDYGQVAMDAKNFQLQEAADGTDK